MAKKTEVLYAPHEQIEEMQLAGIKKTVIDCYEHIDFYKKSFDEAGFDPYSVTSLDDVARIPFVQKQDLRDAYPYGMLAVPLKDVREIHMSSGTTGIATVGAYTEHDRFVAVSVMLLPASAAQTLLLPAVPSNRQPRQKRIFFLIILRNPY